MKQEKIERLKQEQARLEELLFLIDQQRRPRLQKILTSVRGEIAALQSPEAEEPAPESPSLPELRQRQSELEETLFSEPPERRGPVKKLLAQVRGAIESAMERLSPPGDSRDERVASNDESATSLADEKPSGPPRAA